MKNVQKVSFLLVLVMLLSSVVVFANSVKEEEVVVFEVEEVWEKEHLEEGEEFTVYFEYEVEEHEMEIPDGIRFVGFDNGVYTFVAERELMNVSGRLYYKETQIKEEEEEEGGESNSNGDPGGGVATDAPDWDTLVYGKSDWNNGPQGKRYVVRIDLSKYRDHDYIIVTDVASENAVLVDNPDPYVTEQISVKNLNNVNGKVDTQGTTSYEVLRMEGHKFAIKLPVRSDVDVYEIDYYMDYTGSSMSNRYAVYTVRDWVEVEKGGEWVGEIKEYQSLYVRKEWVDKEWRTIDPVMNEVTVQIFNTENEDESYHVKLNEDNNWEYTFNKLDANGKYWVIEPGLDEDAFAVSVHELDVEEDNIDADVGFTVINQYLIEDEEDPECPCPTEPEDKDDEDKDKDPVVPTEPEDKDDEDKDKDPVVPTEPEDKEDEDKDKDPVKPTEPTKPVTPSEPEDNNDDDDDDYDYRPGNPPKKEEEPKDKPVDKPVVEEVEDEEEVDETPVIEETEDEEENPVEEETEEVPVVEEKEENNEIKELLPKTGVDDSPVFTILGLVFIAIGVLGYRKKN